MLEGFAALEIVSGLPPSNSNVYEETYRQGYLHQPRIAWTSMLPGMATR